MAYLEFKNLKIDSDNIKIPNFTIKLNKQDFVVINNNNSYAAYLFNLITTKLKINDSVFIIGDYNYISCNLNEYRKKVSILSNEITLFENLSIINNITLACKNDTYIKKYLNYFKLDKIKYKNIKDLTALEKQKVLAARLLAKDVDIYIIEDITNKSIKEKIINLIKEKNNKSIIIMLSNDKNVLNKANKIIEFKNKKFACKIKKNKGDKNE